jgi:proton-dependent oligopeptide transporter, POT family
VWWQLLAFIVISVAEVMVSITCLEFSYTQAPRRMKSLVMGLYLLSNAVGNFFTAGVNFFIKNPDGTSKLPADQYYWFFAGLMFLTTLVFMVYARFYREKTFIQESEA